MEEEFEEREYGIEVEIPIGDADASRDNSRSTSQVIRTSINQSSPNEVKCFWCRNNFFGEGRSIPVSPSGNLTDGVFCSKECRLSFMNEYSKTYDKSFEILRLEDPDFECTVPALSWRTLKDYGGNFLIDAFREANAKRTDDKRKFLASGKPQGSILLAENVVRQDGSRYIEREFC
jgi:hypothetical protein